MSWTLKGAGMYAVKPNPNNKPWTKTEADQWYQDLKAELKQAREAAKYEI